MMRQNIYQQAEDLADKIRRQLNLGNAPIKDIFTLFENQGIFIVRIPIKGDGLSGAFFYDQKNKQAKMLINSDRTLGHQYFTAAHEFCHFLLDQDKKLIIEDDGGEKPAYEKRADAFAVNFLMPKDGINYFIKSILKNRGRKLNDIDLVKIRNEFCASWEATVNRLYNLGYVFDKSYQEKKKETAKLNFLSMQLGFKPEKKFEREKIILPADYYRLAFNAYFNKKISLNRLAEILRLSYDEAKDKVAEIKKLLNNEQNKK